MQVIKGGIAAATGFKANGVHCGVKKRNKDLALVYSEVAAKWAGTYTTNQVKAAPVLWNKKLIDNYEEGHAIIVNSGVANACTGVEGAENNKEMAEYTAKELGISTESVLVASTGVIGIQLPMDKIKKGINQLVPLLDNNIDSGQIAADAIRTTDLFFKEIAVTVELSGKQVTIGGMSKGSGMIHPNMATMLAFVTTDCNISSDMLRKATKDSITKSYNMISIDGDTSTNDMCLVMANGLADNIEINEENDDYIKFVEALDYVNVYLAKQIAKDGEGATKLLECNVVGANSIKNARKLAKSVIGSSLVKTAMFGEDANWGRILCAMGYAEVDFDTENVEIYLESENGTIKIVEKGTGSEFDEAKASYILSDKNIKINISLQEGEDCATSWGCDFSYEYVKINAEYRS